MQKHNLAGVSTKFGGNMRKLCILRYLVFVLLLCYPALVSASATDIKADNYYYDFETGLYMLEGNVSVRVKDAVIKAQRARVSLTLLEVFADGGISVTQDDICFQGDSVFVIAKERRAIIEGNVKLESISTVITCSKVDFNWKTKNATLFEADFMENGVAKHVAEAVYNVRSRTLQY